MGKYINKRHIFIKPNFTEDFFDKLKNTPSPFAAPYYLYSGRYEEAKGIMELIRIWKKVPQDLFLCGSGPLKSQITDYIIKNNLSQIHDLGQITHDALLNYLFHAEAMIFPSKWYEGFPMTIVESMMCGTPVISSDIGNGSDLIQSCYTDNIYNTEDSFQNVINSSEKKDTGSLFRACYLEHYTADKNYQIIKNIYKNYSLFHKGKRP